MEAVRVFAHSPQFQDFRKFSVDPKLTSFSTLKTLLLKAFDVSDDSSSSIYFYETSKWKILTSDKDLKAAIIRYSSPVLNLELRVHKSISSSFFQGGKEKDKMNMMNTEESFLRKHVEKTLPSLSSTLQRVLSYGAEYSKKLSSPLFSPLSEWEFKNFCNELGDLTHPRELRLRVYQGGLEPRLRKRVWKILLGVFEPRDSSFDAQLRALRSQVCLYESLKRDWKAKLEEENDDDGSASASSEKYFNLTNSIRKDVLRTDRHHSFFAGENNSSLSTLANILTTYALNHPSVGYSQGMSDMLALLYWTMRDEGETYIVFCALMTRLKSNFDERGTSMTLKFRHLSSGLLYTDPEFYAYLQSNKINNHSHGHELIFTYRWLLLECKREFSLEDSCLVSEVLWSSLPPPSTSLELFEKRWNFSENEKSTTFSSIESDSFTNESITHSQDSLPLKVSDVFGFSFTPSDSIKTPLCYQREEFVGYSQANGGTLFSSLLLHKLPSPEEFGDGNPFLMFVCLSLLSQHRDHIMREKMDSEDIILYFNRLHRQHNAQLTLEIARRIFAEYLNDDDSANNLSKSINNC